MADETETIAAVTAQQSTLRELDPESPVAGAAVTSNEDAEYAQYLADKKAKEEAAKANKNAQRDADFEAWREVKMKERAHAEEIAAEEERRKDPAYRMGILEAEMLVLKSRLGFHG